MFEFDEFITGEKFQALADFQYGQGEIPKKDCILYCHTHQLKEFFPLIEKENNNYYLISHNSDGNITDNPEGLREYDYLYDHWPNNVEKWFAQNVNVSHENLIPLPIGLENEYNFPHLQKKHWMLESMNGGGTQIKREKLLYMNHTISTNPKERQNAYYFLKDKNWVTTEYGSNGYYFLNYRNQLLNHHYVLSPSGNGLDCHRTWEALYLECTPIVSSFIGSEKLKDLFKFITFDFDFYDGESAIVDEFNLGLNKSYFKKNHERRELKFSWWKDQILKGTLNVK